MTIISEPAATPAGDLHRQQRRRIKWLRGLGLGLLGAVIFIQAKASPGTVLHELIDDIGFMLIGLAVLGRTWCALYIGGRKLNVLVCEGPYSITRNPLYVFSCIGAAGIGLATGSIMLAAIASLAVYIVLMTVTRNEEAALLQTFGESYRAYLAQTPRFWPKPSLWRDATGLTVAPRKVVQTFFESGLMLLGIPLLELIEKLQQAGIIPVLLYLP